MVCSRQGLETTQLESQLSDIQEMREVQGKVGTDGTGCRKEEEEDKEWEEGKKKKIEDEILAQTGHRFHC